MRESVRESVSERERMLKHTLIFWFKEEVVDELQGGRDKRSKANTVMVLDIKELGWSHDSHMINMREMDGM